MSNAQESWSSARLDALLRASGLRSTHQRRSVYESVATLGHATPESIAQHLKQAGEHTINVSTIYRTLDALAEVGLVTHTHLTHHTPTYHLAEAADHVHLVCRHCAAVMEVSLSVTDGLVAQIRASIGFEVDSHHVSLTGVCQSCLDHHKS